MERKNETWRIALSKGKVFLSLHDPERALKSFELAVAECPVDHCHDLGKILFFLGITLKKLGMSGCALRSWSAASRLDKHPVSGKFLQRFSNYYGMIKQESQELDDWNAYHSIQLTKYLALKKSKKIGTDAERDMIYELICEGWEEMKENVDLSSMDNCEKLAAFSNHRIVFPALTARKQESSTEIPVDFSKKRRITYDDRCYCGSGLPYRLCCGRIPDSDELVNGLF